jgi:hypothetical protein
MLFCAIRLLDRGDSAAMDLLFRLARFKRSFRSISDWPIGGLVAGSSFTSSGLNMSMLDRPDTLLPKRLRDIVSRLSMEGRSRATEGVTGLEELLARKRNTPY